MSDLLTPTRAAPLPLSLLADQPADALLGLISLHRADPRPEKLDLGVGVFRDDGQATPVMRAVKAAEAHIAATQTSKSYLGAEGDILYAERLAEVVLGTAIDRDRTAGVQTPGGTGALRLGAELLARAQPDATVWIGAPTWPNHAPIFAEAGLRTRSHRFYDIDRSTIDFPSMLDELENARAGDILLLHGCCHNPSGANFTAEQWHAIAALCEARGLIPFIDLAYQGLGDGLAEDAAATRMVFEALPTAILAYSCDKNFGLYRERVGALWVQSANAGVSALVRANMLTLARSLWSMPPDHGAAIVRTILEDTALRSDWEAELASMRSRINSLRTALAAAHTRLAAIGDQRGMFAMLPIASEVVVQLRDYHAIYMAGNGRINIAGLSAKTIPAFVAALIPHF